ncbi:MAG: hypothetical protein R3F25_07405 [Gammaproteobacteria bacterium]|nr:hypothetical protein [Xanthomonadales bacterium]
MKNLIYTSLILIVIWFFFFKEEPKVVLSPGVKAVEDPVQVDNETIPSIKFGKYQIKPQAEFSLHGKILSKKYYQDDSSDLTSVDLAMGWGRMSDEKVLESIEISQSGRWYRWNANPFPIPRREIETHSANMHIIAADEQVQDMIERAPAGSIVRFKGYLVRAEKDDGWFWQSSLTRDDTGGGACELVYVKDFYVVEE